MIRLETPDAMIGTPAPDFSLLGTDGAYWTLDQCKGDKGLVVMFICNHCPYVQSKLQRLVEDAKTLQAADIGVVAIMPNDTTAYPQDNYENMQRLAQEQGFTFPYLLDETQSVAKAYGAICTPDFFGYDASLKLQYRGRLDDSTKEPASPDARRELVDAMLDIAKHGQPSHEIVPSMGCSIKWKTDA